jgi:hypothetical protein
MPTLFYRDPQSNNFMPVVGGGNDHGNLFGLTDYDHPQYVMRIGDTMSGDLDITGSLSATVGVEFNGAAVIKGSAGAISVRNIGDTAYANIYAAEPTVASHLATKNYIDTRNYRPIFASTGAPSGGTNGDVWMVYV